MFQGRLDRFGGDHNSNYFVHNGIEGYIQILNFMEDTTLLQMGS